MWNADGRDSETSKLLIGLKTLSTSSAQVICNHCSPPMGNSGDNDFSSTTALLKALHCGELLRVKGLVFIIVISTGVYLRNATSPALRGNSIYMSPYTVSKIHEIRVVFYIACIWVILQKWGNLGKFFLLKNNTNNFDLFYFALKSEHLTTTKHIRNQENLRNNIFLTYFNSCTGAKCHSCYRNMKPYFLKNPLSWCISFSLPKKRLSRSPKFIDLFCLCHFIIYYK